ncbi:hypothetical protein RJ640_018827 [Escallonia rubra]|uniref:(S)-N-methylcoclaurine 3'-hydroxylase isozyme 2 n=1 Tax=Escallonia rubra TaxID=112253 RepID=A0AA88UPU2_9ASTE|nr:hypothetical protein RJ640_018827 [Escallonia rubra]
MALKAVTEGGTYLLLLLLLLPLFLLFILKNFKSSRPPKTPPLPPGPKPWPVIGNILHMGKKPHLTLTSFAQTYGPLVSLRLGTQTLVVGSSSAAAMEILKTHDRVLSGRCVPFVSPAKNMEMNHISMGWSVECNENWKFLRTLCRTELFSGAALESQACLRENKVMDMVKYLSGKEGKVVKIAEVVFATLFNVLSSLMISKDFITLGEEGEEGEDGGIKDRIRRILETYATPNLSDFYPVLGKFDLQGLQKKSEVLMERVCAMWEPIVEERKGRLSGDSSCQQDFLDTLLTNSFSNDQINHLLLVCSLSLSLSEFYRVLHKYLLASELEELLTAGTETSASTIEWAMAELMRSPECMTKVREELVREAGQDFPKESQLSQLPYLQACVKECLRLHPPTPLMLPHRALESCQVMNYTVPKNAQLVVNVWAIGRDPMSWEEPLKFKPERFLSSALDFKGNDFEFLPFGAGRRICPGLPMAARHVPLVLASLIHSFDWSLPLGKSASELDMTEKLAITLQKEQPLLLIPKVRK